MSPSPSMNLAKELERAGKLSFHSAGDLNLTTAKKIVVIGKLDDLQSAAAEISPTLEALLEDLTVEYKIDAQAKTETVVPPPPPPPPPPLFPPACGPCLLLIHHTAGHRFLSCRYHVVGTVVCAHLLSTMYCM